MQPALLDSHLNSPDQSAHLSLQTPLRADTRFFCLTCYKKYCGELQRFAAKNYGLYQLEVEDLVHAAFEKFASHSQLTSIRNPRAFLYKLINNLALNNFRHANVKRDFANHIQECAENAAMAVSQDPEAIVQQRQSLEIISNVVLNMPVTRRRIVIMNRFEHLSYAEIGRQLGISEAAVRKHIKCALREINRACWQTE